MKRNQLSCGDLNADDDVNYDVGDDIDDDVDNDEDRDTVLAGRTMTKAEILSQRACQCHR